MKILIVYPSFYVSGGGEQLVVRLCNYLSSQGIFNGLLTTSMIDDVEKELIDTRIHIERIENEDSQASIRSKYKKQLIALRRGIEKYSAIYDCINPHNFPAEMSCVYSRKPIVWMCNEPELFLIKNHPNFKRSFSIDRLYFLILFFLQKKLIKKYYTHIVVSDNYNADRIKSIYKIFPHINNYGIDYDFFSKFSSKKYSWKDKIKRKFIVLHVGMITPYKNQIESLKVLHHVIDIIPNIILIFAGGDFDKVYKSQLDEYIKKYKLEDYVLFTGHIDRLELRNLYHSSSLLIHPIKAQGGWLSPFEMLCAGNPIIVSKVMTASSIINNEDIGIVTEDYANAITEIYKNYKFYKKEALNGKIFVKNNLNWNRFGEKMLEIFKLAVNENR
jgi:glycosyltransferase involved in cell wall biosynthesis